MNHHHHVTTKTISLTTILLFLSNLPYQSHSFVIPRNNNIIKIPLINSQQKQQQQRSSLSSSSSTSSSSNTSSSTTTTTMNDEATELNNAWWNFLSSYPPSTTSHIYGSTKDASTHTLSALQRITARRLLDDQQSPQPSPSSVDYSTSPPLNLFSKIQSCHPSLSLAAEFKRASPSKGDINPSLDPAAQASAYAKANASIISILTETRHFKGSLDDLTAARRATEEEFGGERRPCILRKDFVISTTMIEEAWMAGADTVLLIVAVLPSPLLEELIAYCREECEGMEPLVEVHAMEELDVALSAGAKVIGVNNRNLHTFSMDLGTTDKMVLEMEKRGVSYKFGGDDSSSDVVVGSLSGISNAMDVERYRRLGVGMVLIGESLMKASDPVVAIRGLCLHPNDYKKSLTGTSGGGVMGAGGSYVGGTKLVKICGITNETDALMACRAGANLIGIIFVPKSKRCVGVDDVSKAKAIVKVVRDFGERSDRVAIDTASLESAGDAVTQLLRKSQLLEQSALSRRPLVVGVFQNQSPKDIAAIVQEVGLDMVQLHGTEGFAAAHPSKCGGVPALRVVDLPPAEDDDIDRDAMTQGILAQLTSDPLAVLLDTTLKKGSAGGGTGKVFDWEIVKSIQNKGLPVIIAGGLTPENVGMAVKDVGPWGVDVSSGVEAEVGRKSQEKVKSFVEGARRAAVEANKGF